MNILDIDLNDVVSREIQQRIEDLESTLSDRAKTIISLKTENKELANKLSDINDFSVLFDVLKKRFDSITETEPDKDGWGAKSKTENKYLFIKDLMSYIFGVKEKHGFIPEWGLAKLLALNFYEAKPSIIALCRALNVSNYSHDKDSIVSFIENFKMPYDYSKDKILAFVKNPHYCTNGAMFGISRYWDGKDSNTPHDLLCASKYIVEEDIFKEVINTLSNNRRSDDLLLYAIPRYNDLISDEQIQKMGETLITKSPKYYSWDYISYFITKNLHKFNKKTLDHLYSYSSSDNQFKLFHWQNFPYEYQCKYLMSKSFSEINNILNQSSCKWSEEEKENFMRKYFNRTL